MNKSLLLPREKYSEAAKKWGRSPIMMEIENEKQCLYYFGANHSRDPENHQYPILKEYWEKFLYKTNGKDRIILIEGGIRPLDIKKDIAVKKNAEAGYITFISNTSHIKIESPDISDGELVRILSDLNKEEFLLYWFLVFIDTFQRLADPKPDFSKHLNNWCEYQNRKRIWVDIEISYEYLKHLYKNIIGKDFDLNESQNTYVDPNRTDSKINLVARISSDARDVNIVQEIERHWNGGKSIFVVFGNGHLIIQEPALRQLIK